MLLPFGSEKPSPVLLGLDPREGRIPEDCYPSPARDAEATGVAFRNFGCRLLDALKGEIRAVKVQIAFYEALGIAGLKAYIETLAHAKKLEIPVIADVKRGDIASTAEAYARAHLAGDFEADAVTLSPWLGKDSIQPFVNEAKNRGKGLYLLLHTSNPGSKDLQELRLKNGDRVFEALANLIAAWQQELPREGDWSPMGVVVGATWRDAIYEMKLRLPGTPFLVPGFGAQGGTAEDVACLFENDQNAHLVNASRSIIFAFEKDGGSLEDAALNAARTMKHEILQAAEQ